VGCVWGHVDMPMDLNTWYLLPITWVELTFVFSPVNMGGKMIIGVKCDSKRIKYGIKFSNRMSIGFLELNLNGDK
jgi:hypothetical protein